MNIIQKAIASLFGGDEKKGYKGRVFVGDVFHSPTKQKRGGRRHRPYTKPPMLGESKRRRQMAAKSRRINREK